MSDVTDVIDETGGEYDVVLLPEEQAHIVFPEVPIDLKALALCGKKWKPKQYDADVPPDMFTCPDCIEMAVTLLREAHAALLLTTKRLDLINHVVDQATEELTLEIPTFLDVIETGNQYAEKQTEKALAKLQRRMDKEAAKAERLGKQEPEQPDLIVGDVVISRTDGKTYEVTGLDKNPNYVVVRDETGKRKVRSVNTLVYKD